MIRRTETKEIIFQSLVELCQKTAVDKISVSDIMENCGYKRETFYYYYKSKEDLIVSALRDSVQKNHEIYSEERSWEYVMRKNLEFCEKHRHLMIWLSANVDQSPAELHSLMFEYMCRYVLNDETLLRAELSKTGSLRFYCGGIAAVVECWIKNHFRESKEEIAALIAAQMPREWLNCKS